MTYLIELGAPSDLAEAVAIDEDACGLFDSVGITVSGSAFEAYSHVEQARWRSAAERGELFFARDGQGARVGLVVLDRIDGEPYLEQLSVRQNAARRGLGRLLLEHALDWARSQRKPVLWLATYGHLAWNRPFYETAGFSCVDERDWGPGMRARLAEQRAILPMPEQRVVMCKALTRA